MKTISFVALLSLLFSYVVKSQEIDVVKDNTKFAFDFYSKVSEKETGNIFFSPISLSSAMSMTFAGSSDETKNQISKVFHFESNDKKYHQKQGKVIRRYSSNADSIKISLVNTLWAEKTYPFKKDYNKLIKKCYSATIHQVDFVGKAEESRIQINNDISKLTFDKIKDLLPSGSINSLTRLVLTNAIYFKGNWKVKFDKKKTFDGNFYITHQNKINCKMMGVKSRFNYYEGPKVQAIELPYKGGNFSMVIILPSSGVTLADYTKDFTHKTFEDILKGMSSDEISVSIPKFKISTGYQLKPLLSEMGMPLAFTDYATFSNMTSRNDLKISDVFHKAYIEVNEEGTEAAAATAVVIAVKSIGNEKYFVANRPFIFLIRDRVTGTILFIGRVVDPSKGE